MYPIDVSSLMHRSLHGMNADDPTVPYTPSLARRLALALRSRPTRAAGVVAIAPSAPSWERTADRTRRCA